MMASESEGQDEQEFPDETLAFSPAGGATEKLSGKAREVLVDNWDQDILASPGTLLFYLSGVDKPALFQNAERITIGRMRSVEGEGVAFDLSEYDGAQMGVSRQHAAVHVLPNGYFLEDLKSTNGSWLNSERLEPLTRYALSNGDHIRLGDLMMHVYFSEAVKSTTMQAVFLVSGEDVPTHKKLALTPGFLSDEVAVYLSALETLQGLAVGGQLAREPVRIQTIRLSSDHQRVRVEMTPVNPAIQIIETHIVRARQTHMEDVRMTRFELKVQSTRAVCDAFQADEEAAMTYLGPALDSLVQQISRNLQRGDSDSLGKLRRACFTLLVSPLVLVAD